MNTNATTRPTRRKASGKRPPGAPPAGELVGTCTQLADALDLHRNTISRIIRERGIAAVGKVHGRPVYPVKDVLREIRQTNAGEVSLDKLSPFERDAMTRSLQRELEMRVRAGELLDANDVRREYAWFCRIVADQLELFPDVLERDTGLPGPAIQLAEECVNQIRRQLYERLSDHHQEPMSNGKNR